jgi:hypothetical protein
MGRMLETFVDFLVRGIGVAILILVMLAAARGVWWLVRPSTAVQVRQFDVIKGGEVQKGQGEIVARWLAARIAAIDGILGADLRDLPLTSGARIDSVISPAFHLKPTVPSRLEFEFKPFNFDVIGVLNAAAGLLRRGPELHGTVAIADKEFEIFAEYSIGDGRTSYGPWPVQSQIGLPAAIEELAYAVAFDIQRGRNPQLDVGDAVSFRVVVEAMREYQTYLRGGGPERKGALDHHLHTALGRLAPLAALPTTPGLVFSYIGSIHTMLGDSDKARVALREAVVRNPGDRFARDTLDQIERKLALRPVPTPLPAEAAEPLRGLFEQPALQRVQVSPAIAEAGGGGDPIAVAVLADGGGPAVPELQDRFISGRSFVPDEPVSSDASGHGSAVANLIAAIAPSARIMPVKVLSSRVEAPRPASPLRQGFSCGPVARGSRFVTVSRREA